MKKERIDDLEIDPAAKKMSDRQWEQAYAAYRRTRERTRGRHSAEHGGGRRSDAWGRGGPPSLRERIRRHTVYADTRLLVDILAWLAVAFAVIAGIVSLLMYGDATGGTFAVMKAAFQVAAVLGLRLLAHVVIDLADITLYRAQSESDDTDDAEASEDNAAE